MEQEFMMQDFPQTKQSLGLGTLISETFGLFFRRFWLFMGVVMVPSLILSLVSDPFLLMSGTFEGGPDAGALSPVPVFDFGLLQALYVVAVLVFPLVIVAFAILAAGDARMGLGLSPGRYVQRILGGLLAILVLGFVFYLMFMLGFLLLVLPGLYVIGIWGLFVPLILLEGAGFRALGRSADLTRGYRWPIVGGWVVIYLIVVLITVPFGLIANPALWIALTGMQSDMFQGGLGGLIFMLVSAVGSGLQYAIIGIFTYLLYERLRNVQEGAGPQDLASVFR